ncbi:hypothetical protein BDQ17DRAFT_1353988, partial [Cyathus striatus]
MISAVAARKAAQAALAQASQQHLSRVDTPTPSSSTTSVQEQEIAPPSKSSSKRRQSGTFDDGKAAKKAKGKQLQNKEPVKRKGKKKMGKPRSTTRYFPQPTSEDAFTTQADLIEVESDSEESDSDLEDNDLLSDDGMEGSPMDESSSMVKPSKKQAVQRAWSPSIPVSSDEEEGEDDQANITVDEDVSSLFPHTSAPNHRYNLFILTADEVSSISSVVDIDIDNAASTTIVLLTPSTTLCLLGSCSFVVLSGSVSVLGTTLIPSRTKHDLFAPRSSPLPVFEAIPTKSKSIVEADQLPQRLVYLSSKGDTLLLLQEVHRGLEGLGTYKNAGFVTAPFGIDHLWMAMQQTKDAQPFILPPTWMRALDVITPQSNVNEPASLLEAPIFLVKGPKKSGKSTFARTLLNRLLQHYTHVAFVECDLGQSEFTPGGLVSLHVISSPVLGPPFTHLTVPHTAHYVGSTTPRSSPSLYLDSVRSLIETYRLELSFAPQNPSEDGRNDEVIPLVVNTMGWTKGLGADLNAKIEEIVGQAPSTPDRASGYLPNGPQRIVKVHTLEPILPSAISALYSASDHRTLALLSYFHAQLTAKTWCTSLPLCAFPPYEVTSEDVVPSEIGAVLNGAIVGMVKCESGPMEIDTDLSRSSISTTGIPYIQGQSPPLPPMSNCIGLGLIRAVSPPQTSVSGNLSYRSGAGWTSGHLRKERRTKGR